MTKLLRFALGTMLCAFALPARTQTSLDKGWWVVLATFSNEPSGLLRHAKEMDRKLAPCGFKPFNDVSTKFSGFAPDLQVFVLGAYPTKQAANNIKDTVRSCSPGAYIKFGGYAGE